MLRPRTISDVMWLHTLGLLDVDDVLEPRGFVVYIGLHVIDNSSAVRQLHRVLTN
jgi:hypothetical protein